MALWGSDFNQIQQDYYNSPENYGEAEDLYFRSMGLTGNALEYARRQAASIKAAFGNYALSRPNENPLFTTWLAQGGSQQLINGYNMLSARSRGANPGAFQTSRMMF